MKSKIITIISILLLVWGAYSLGCQKREIEEVGIVLTDANKTQNWTYLPPKISKPCCVCGRELKSAWECATESELAWCIEGQDDSIYVCQGCVINIIKWAIDEYKKTKANK